ncbi:DUF981 domain-containing protein [Corynebacterium sp. S7]
MRDFFMGVSTPGAIAWETLPTYNTIMSIAVGAGLVALVLFNRAIQKEGKEVSLDGWALTFGVLGFILTATGLHMTLTWPLAPDFAFDNIVFGETSLAFGVLMLAAAIYLWRRQEKILESENMSRTIAQALKPLSIFIAGLGLALFAIALAGIVYQLFAAPPQEPISGYFGAWPILEATFMGILFAMVGLGAVLLPIANNKVARGEESGTVGTWVHWLWLIAGVVFILFGAMNFYTHIGLIVNTM